MNCLNISFNFRLHVASEKFSFKMKVTNSDQNNSGNSVYVVPELFSNELEEILLKIFLFLDPKSLKNSKLACSQWRKFIDRRIWASPTAMKVLHRRLISNWMNEDQVKVSKIILNFYPTIAVCDDAVMVFGDHQSGRCSASVSSSSTQELLYDLTFHPVDVLSIGRNFICLFHHNMFVTIIEKFTGKKI